MGSSGADAQTPERHKLLQDALTARKADDFETAIKWANRARKIRATPSILLFIAEEQTALGQYSNSWANAQRCAEARQDNELQDREGVLKACNTLMTLLNQKGARLIISMPSPLPSGAEVIVQGHIFPETHYGQPYLLMPGRIKVEAKAPGRGDFSQEFPLKAGEEKKVEVPLPPR